MRKKNNISKIAAEVAGIAATAFLPGIAPAINTACNNVNNKLEEWENLITVPNLYSKEYPLTVEQALELLDNCGLKASLVKASRSDANAKYRNCFDNQVIHSRPRANQKVEPGTIVLLKYISQEVIDESRRLFEEEEKQKAELSLIRTAKRSEQKEKTKQLAANVIDTAKTGVGKIPSALQTAKTGIGKIPSAFHKKSDKEEQEEFALPEQTEQAEQED